MAKLKVPEKIEASPELPPSPEESIEVKPFSPERVEGVPPVTEVPIEGELPLTPEAEKAPPAIGQVEPLGTTPAQTERDIGQAIKAVEKDPAETAEDLEEQLGTPP